MFRLITPSLFAVLMQIVTTMVYAQAPIPQGSDPALPTLDVRTTGTPPVITDLIWLHNGTATPAVTQDILRSLSGNYGLAETQLVRDPAYAVAVLKIPPVYSAKAKGSAVLLQPGKTVDTLSDDIVAQPHKIQLTKEGYYFTFVRGDLYKVAFQHINGTYEELDKVSYVQIKNGDASIELAPGGATIRTATQQVTRAHSGKTAEANLLFNDLNSAAADVLYEFGGVDLIASAKKGNLDAGLGGSPDLARVVSRLQSKQLKNSILWGDAGVNPETIVYQLAHNIAAGKVPEELKSWKVYQMNWSAFNAEGLVDKAISKMQKVMTICRQKKVILYFPEIQNLKNLGVDPNSSDNRNDIASAMVDDLTTGRLVVIGTSSGGGLNALRSTGKFINSFSTIEIKPPSGEDLYEALVKAAKAVKDEHSIVFDETLLRKVIELTDQFIYDEKQPNKSLRVLREVAKLYPGKDQDNLYTATEIDVKKWMATYTGVATLGADSKTGIMKFLKPEVYEKEINERLVGHQSAKKALHRALVNIVGGSKIDEDGNGELGVEVLFFTGPSGTGKSMIPQELARVLRKPEYGVDWDVFPIQGAQFKDEASVRSLFGAPPSFVGYKADGSNLYQWVRNHPQGIIVFEEIDKMHPQVLESLYEFLDHGTIQDASLQTARFTRGLVILTSNFGSVAEARLNDDQSIDEGSRACELIDDFDRWHRFKTEPKVYNEDHPKGINVKKFSVPDLQRALVKRLTESRAITQAFAGRIGDENIQILHHFSREELNLIGIQELERTREQYKKRYKLDLVFTDKLKSWMIDQAWGSDGSRAFEQGARAMLNVTKNQILNVTAKKIVLGEPEENKNKRWIVDIHPVVESRAGQQVTIQETFITVEDL